MAIYIVNDLLSTGDALRTGRGFSSAQSLHRSGKNGHTHVVKIGRMHFLGWTAVSVAEFHNISSWQGLNTITQQHLPGGLCSLKSAGKKAKVSPAQIIAWAAVNRINVYWVSGHFFTHLQPVQEIVSTEQKRIASLTKPPKVRRRRTFLT